MVSAKPLGGETVGGIEGDGDCGFGRVGEGGTFGEEGGR